MPITSTRTSRSQGEDLDVILSGTVLGGEQIDEIVFDPAVPEGAACTTARMMGATYSMQPGVEALLYWEGGNDDHDLICPIDGRGFLDFSTFGGLMNPRREGWTGKILLRVTCDREESLRHFSLALHLTKQRS